MFQHKEPCPHSVHKGESGRKHSFEEREESVEGIEGWQGRGLVISVTVVGISSHELHCRMRPIGPSSLHNRTNIEEPPIHTTSRYLNLSIFKLSTVTPLSGRPFHAFTTLQVKTPHLTSHPNSRLYLQSCCCWFCHCPCYRLVDISVVVFTMETDFANTN